MKHILTAALLLLSAHAGAGQTLIVGVEEAAFMPHYAVDAQGAYRGFARDLLDMFAADSGVQLIYKPMPVGDLLPALIDGRIDLKYPDNPNWAGAAKAGQGIHYSQPVVNYVDGVMVAPRRVGLGVEQLKRLAIVDGWTPWGYQDRINDKQVLLVGSADLPQMMRQALLKDSDGAYYNVVVASHYLNNVRAKPGVLVFDPKLPHTRSTFNLSSIKYPEVIQRFDAFLSGRRTYIAELKARYQVEANLFSEYIGMEQWKIEFLERKKARQQAAGS